MKNFLQYKPEELIGKWVHIHGHYRQSVAKITEVNKATFKARNTLFNLSNGRERGGNTYSSEYAELISDEKANELRAAWAIEKELRNGIETITTQAKNLPIEKVRAILEIINKQ